MKMELKKINRSMYFITWILCMFTGLAFTFYGYKLDVAVILIVLGFYSMYRFDRYKDTNN